MKRRTKDKSAICTCMAVGPKRARRQTIGVVKYKRKSGCNKIQSFTRLKRARSRSRSRSRNGRARSRSR